MKKKMSEMNETTLNQDTGRNNSPELLQEIDAGENKTNETQAISDVCVEEEVLPFETCKSKIPNHLQIDQKGKSIKKHQWVLDDQGSSSDRFQKSTQDSYNRESDLSENKSLLEKVVGHIDETNQQVSECHEADRVLKRESGISKNSDDFQKITPDQFRKSYQSEPYSNANHLSRGLKMTNQAAVGDETSGCLNSAQREASDIASTQNKGSNSSGIRKRPNSKKTSNNIVFSATNVSKTENERSVEDPDYKRRKVFNIVKHVVSIVLVVFDVIFDWVEYDEMNSRAVYEIVAERQVNNIKFTYKCEETGETIQSAYTIFTVVGTVLSIVQISNIVYQIFYELKNENRDKRFLHEYIETFVILCFIKISQLILIMGFFDVCSLNCVIQSTEIFLTLNTCLSVTRISWRWLTSSKCCTLYSNLPQTKKQSARKPKTSRNECLQSTKTPTVSPPQSQYSTKAPTVSPPQSQYSTKAPTESPAKSRKLSQPPFESPPETSQLPSTLRYPIHKRGCCLDTNSEGCIGFLACILFPLFLPLLPFIGFYFLMKSCSCPCDACNKQVQASGVKSEKFECEQSCKCCILRCFPPKFDDTEDVPYTQEPDICTCQCGECMAREIPCKCFTFRCCPSYLGKAKNKTDVPCTQEPDICTCQCGECMAREIPCKCFTFRCCPSYLGKKKNKADVTHTQEPAISPQEPDICTCQCGECMAREIPCKCFTFRCCPSYLGKAKNKTDVPCTQEPDICTCQCGECMAREIPCKCFTFRCCPSYLGKKKNKADVTHTQELAISPQEPDICTCQCGDCMAREIPCKCFTFRCCPSYLGKAKNKTDVPCTQEPDICTCQCGECMAREIPCKCFTFRCCPSYLGKKKNKADVTHTQEPAISPQEPDICTCQCGECMAREMPCKCFTFRCCPSYLGKKKNKADVTHTQEPAISPQEPDICTCQCGECMAREIPCKCFTFRCCPSYLGKKKNKAEDVTHTQEPAISPQEPDICTCQCGECMAREIPCKCFTFRCCPSYLGKAKNKTEDDSRTRNLDTQKQDMCTQELDICTCQCTQCLSCEFPCPCCVCRCFPVHQGKNDWFNCLCGECLACEKTCYCCVCRICPSKLESPKNDIFQCLCRSICTCCKNKAVTPTSDNTSQPQSHPQLLSSSSSSHKKTKVCTECLECDKMKSCLSKCQHTLIALCLLFIIVLYLFYLCLIGIQLQYVLVCTVNETVMETTQVILVRNFVSLF